MNEIPTYKFALRQELENHVIDFMPTRGTEKATGWDVRAAWKDDTSGMVIQPLQKVKIPLGFRSYVPNGWWFELKPRSSTFGKKSLHSLYGTIDEDYEGELLFACQYIPEKLDGECLLIDFGEAIGQIIPVKRQEMKTEKVSNEEIDRLFKARNFLRGAGGFGSTSK